MTRRGGEGRWYEDGWDDDVPPELVVLGCVVILVLVVLVARLAW